MLLYDHGNLDLLALLFDPVLRAGGLPSLQGPCGPRGPCGLCAGLLALLRRRRHLPFVVPNGDKELKLVGVGISIDLVL